MNTAAAKVIQFDAITAEEKAHIFNEEFDQCHVISVNHGHPLEDEARADQFELFKLAAQVAAIKFPDLKTEEANHSAQAADAILRLCVDEVMEGIETI